MDYQNFKDDILRIQRSELPKDLYYHSYDHILDVLDAGRWLAKKEKIGRRNQILLDTAILLHDSGFIRQGHQNHEEASCNIAWEMLPEYGFSEKSIEKICKMIMATKIPQRPTDHLSEIICDADLDYLGRDDFELIGERLFREMLAYGMLKNEREWNRIQVKFLENHHYHTKTAQKLRSSKKEMHLRNLIEIVSAY